MEQVEIFERGEASPKNATPPPIWAHNEKTGPHEVKRAPKWRKIPHAKKKAPIRKKTRHEDKKALRVEILFYY